MSAVARRIAQILVGLSLTLPATMCGLACDTGDVMDEFRAASSDAFATGLKSIASGLIDGLFALFEPDTGSASGSASST